VANLEYLDDEPIVIYLVEETTLGRSAAVSAANRTGEPLAAATISHRSGS